MRKVKMRMNAGGWKGAKQQWRIQLLSFPQELI